MKGGVTVLDNAWGVIVNLSGRFWLQAVLGNAWAWDITVDCRWSLMAMSGVTVLDNAWGVPMNHNGIYWLRVVLQS